MGTQLSRKSVCLTSFSPMLNSEWFKFPSSSLVLYPITGKERCLWVTMDIPGRRKHQMLRRTSTSRRSWGRKCWNHISFCCWQYGSRVSEPFTIPLLMMRTPWRVQQCYSYAGYRTLTTEGHLQVFSVPVLIEFVCLTWIDLTTSLGIMVLFNAGHSGQYVGRKWLGDILFA